jgi:hypothetical protein
MALAAHIIQQLGMDQVHLPEIGLLAEPPDVIEVLVGRSGVRIALHTPVLDQADRRFGRLAEGVLAVAVDRDDNWLEFGL